MITQNADNKGPLVDQVKAMTPGDSLLLDGEEHHFNIHRWRDCFWLLFHNPKRGSLGFEFQGTENVVAHLEGRGTAGKLITGSGWNI